MGDAGMEAKLDVNGDGVVLTLGGSLSIWHVGEMRQYLAEALEQGRSIDVRFGDVDQIDIAALQLICAALRSAGDQEKTLTIHGTGTPVETLAREAGVELVDAATVSATEQERGA